MKHIYTSIALLLLLLGACNEPEFVVGVEVPQTTGTVEFEGLKCEFNVTFDYVTCKNLSLKDMKVELFLRNEDDSYTNLHTSSFLELPFGTGGSVTYKDLSPIKIGDIIEIDLWKDEWLVLGDEFLNNAPPDFIKETVIVGGDMSFSDSIKRERFDVTIRDNGSSIAGVVCTISGIFFINDPGTQTNNALYCKNNSSNAVRVQLFQLQEDSPGNYSDTAEIVDFSSIPQVGEDSDLDEIPVEFVVDELLALKVTKNILNPLDYVVYGFTMDHTTGIQNKLQGTIDVP